MKILHIIFSLQYGGAETMLVDILNEQIRNNDVYLLIINDDYSNLLLSTIDEKVKIAIFKRKKSSFDLFVWLKIILKVSEIKPDVIHSHDSKAIYFLPLNLCEKILTVHAVNLSLKGIEKYSSIVAVSNAVKDDIFNRSHRISKLIFNGINPDLILKRSKKEIGQFNIVQIGRLDHSIKGQHILLKALYLLRKDYNYNSINLDFIGEGVSYTCLNKLVSDYQLNECVHFLGLKDRTYIYNHLKDYDLLVQPSIYEGFGLTIVEAMAAKVPVLVSDVYGPLEVIKNGSFGFYFESENSYQCALKIKHIIDSYLLGGGFVDDAYKYCYSNFHIKNTVNKYIDLYSQLNEANK